MTCATRCLIWFVNYFQQISHRANSTIYRLEETVGICKMNVWFLEYACMICCCISHVSTYTVEVTHFQSRLGSSRCMLTGRMVDNTVTHSILTQTPLVLDQCANLFTIKTDVQYF